VGGKQKMENKILLGFIMFSVFSLGFLSYSHAEPFTVEVPFDYNKSGCTLTANTTDYKFYDCYASFQAVNATEFLPDLVWDEVDKEYKTPEQLEKEAKEDYAIQFEDDQTFEDPHLESMVDSLGDSSSDLKAEELIDNYIGGKCYQGADGTTTAGIQDENSFEIPTIDEVRWVDGEKVIVQVLDRSQTTNEDLKGIVGYIISHQQECIAEEKLLDESGGILSVVDKHFAYCDDVPNTSVEFDPNSGKPYLDHSGIGSNVPTYSQDRVNQESNFGVDMADNTFDIVEDVCEGYYTESYKMTFQECRDIRDSKVVISGGHVPDMEIQNSIEDRYNQYLADGGKAQAEELRKKAIQDKISELYRQLKASGQ
jgi:hypothetical protein